MPASGKYLTQADRQRAYRKRQTEARIAELQARGLPAMPRIPSMPGTARWKAMKEAAHSLLETVLAEMEHYQGERSQEWQDSQRGADFQEATEQVREACEFVGDIY
jgi:hypothetical protein